MHSFVGRVDGSVDDILLEFLNTFTGDLGRFIEFRVDAGDVGIDLSFVLLEQSLEEVSVDDVGTLGLGVEEINVEGNSEDVEEGDEREDEVNKALEDVNETKNNPVGQPEFIIFMILSSLDSLETHISRIEESNEEGDPGNAIFKED